MKAGYQILTVSVLLGAATQAQPISKMTPSQIRAYRSSRTKVSKNHGSGGAFNDPSNGMSVTAGVSATALATALLGSGVTLSGTPTFAGAAAQEGTFTNAPALVGFSSGVILSSGNAADAASTYAGSDLPNTNESTAGYAPLNALISGQSTFDAAVLQFSFIPTTSTIYFKYVFASAEYPNYVGSYNDPMGLFLNGTAPGNNIAFLPTAPPVAVTINNVNPSTNSAYFNKYNGSGDQLPYGGETKVLTATANVNPNVVNTITLAVADALDNALDSAVFIQSGSFTTTTPTPTVTPTPTPVIPSTPAPPSLILTMLGLGAAGIFMALKRRGAQV